MFNSQAPAYTNVPLVESLQRLLQKAQKGRQGYAQTKVGLVIHICGYLQSVYLYGSFSRMRGNT